MTSWHSLPHTRDIPLDRELTNNLERAMAKRGFDTSFWTGKYVRSLPPYEKLTYCYLINYPMGTISGIFEEDLDQFSFDLGISQDVLGPIIDRLVADGKAVRVDGKLALTKWNKHQAGNPSVVSGIKRQLQTFDLQALYTLRDGEYTLPSYMRWDSLIKSVEDREISYEDSQAATGSPQLGSANLTKPNLTKPHHGLKPIGGGGLQTSAGMSPAGPVHPAGWSLAEEELDLLDAEFPELDIDGEYQRAQHGTRVRGESVRNPVAYMRARLMAISESN